MPRAASASVNCSPVRLNAQAMRIAACVALSGLSGLELAFPSRSCCGPLIGVFACSGAIPCCRLSFTCRLASLLLRFGLRYAWQAGSIDILHETAQLGRFHAEPAGQAVIAAGLIDHNKIAPVAARQYITGSFHGGPKTLPAIAAFPQRLQFIGDSMRIDTVLRAAKPFLLLRATFRPLEFPVRNQNAFPALRGRI